MPTMPVIVLVILSDSKQPPQYSSKSVCRLSLPAFLPVFWKGTRVTMRAFYLFNINSNIYGRSRREGGLLCWVSFCR